MARKKKSRRHQLIMNYGLFWHRSRIVWGRGNNRGHLKGRLARTGTPVDFRDQRGVYCLYDDNFRLVYIGQAGGGNKQRLFGRLKHHTKNELADRWTKFSWFGIRPVNPMSKKLRAEKKITHPQIGDVINHIEAILIAATEPPHNSHSGRFGREVHQYLQYEDHQRLDGDTKDLLKEALLSLNIIEDNTRVLRIKRRRKR